MSKAHQLNVYEWLDALALESLNFKEEFFYLVNRCLGRYKFLEVNTELKGRHDGQRCFIVGNGPSLASHDLSRLSAETVFMVNRAFLFPSYSVIQPKYHVIVDPKLATGQWPVDYLDQIIEANPKVTFLLNADWFYLPKFSRFKDRVPIYWLKTKRLSPRFIPGDKIDLTKMTYSYFVVEQCITASIYMGFSPIYLLGYEGDGIAHLLLDDDSHFHGRDPDYANATPFDLSRAMYFNSRFIRVLYILAAYAAKHEVDLCNLTPRGVITMMRRDEFENVF